MADSLEGTCDAVAVSLLHAYAHPENERRVSELLHEQLDVPVSASHEVLAAFREYERTATTVAERFHDEHERVRGYRLDEPVDLVNCRVTATVPGDPPTIEHDPQGDLLLGKRDAFFPSGFYRAPVYNRARVPVEVNVDGPAVFAGGESTVVLPPGLVGPRRRGRDARVGGE